MSRKPTSRRGTMTPERFVEIGSMLWGTKTGNRWKPGAQRALGLSAQAVYMRAAGKHQVTVAEAYMLEDLARRHVELQAALTYRKRDDQISN